MSERRGLALAWGVVPLHAALFFALGVDRYAAHRALVDFGLFTQTTASAFAEFANTFEGTSHWAFHFSPILYLCAPFVLLAHSGLALTAIQALAVAFVIPAAYLLAVRRCSPGRALGIAGIVALYPPLAGVDFTDFHENGFAPAATLWLLWAIDRRAWPFACAFALLALSIKEDQALFMAFLGAVAFVAFGRREERAGMLFGAGLTLVSLVLFAAYFLWIRPLAGSPQHWQPTRFYAWSANDWGLLTSSLPGRFGYVLLALTPLAFVPLRSRVMWLALPGLAECLLSREPAPYTMGQHYAGIWIPYVLAAFALAAARLPSARLVTTSAALCTLTFLVANPLHPGYFLRVPGERDARLDAFLRRLPPQASIGTQEEAYTHLGFDRAAQLGLAGEPEYVLLDRDFPDSVWLGWTEPKLREEIAAERYVPVKRDGGIELYRRTDVPR